MFSMEREPGAILRPPETESHLQRPCLNSRCNRKDWQFAMFRLVDGL